VGGVDESIGNVNIPVCCGMTDADEGDSPLLK